MGAPVKIIHPEDTATLLVGIGYTSQRLYDSGAAERFQALDEKTMAHRGAGLLRPAARA
jgi:hypothetical protein